MTSERTIIAVAPWLCLALALSTVSCKKGGGGGEKDTTTDAEEEGLDVTDEGDEDAAGDPVPEVEEDPGDPCWPYPCAPYGYELGNVAADVSFQPGNAAASAMTGDDDSFDFHDLYQRNEEHGGSLRGVLLFLTTGWCTYCAQEAPKLEGLYTDLADDGILIVGVVSENDSGSPADATFANTYATRYGWTFPAVAGDLNVMFYPPDDRSSPGVPLHVFLDLRTMKIYGRFPGAVEMKLPRQALEEIAAGPAWGPSGERVITFDCSPGTGNETEDNSLAETPHVGTTLPVTLTGTQCPPQIGDGIIYEEDVIDLGNLAAGTAVQVSMTATSDDTYPWFQLLSVASGRINWSNMGPAVHDGDSARRQWVIHQAGHYYAATIDGRYQSSSWYASGTTIPVEDQCCEGGTTYTYELTVESFTLAATESALTVGVDATAAMDGGDLNVHPFTAASGTAYTITMTANDNDFLDPLLVLYDPGSGAVLAENDDIDYPTNINSRISWTATGDMEVWVVASYWGAWYRMGAPGYTLRVE